jgi:protein kinase 2
VVDGQYEPRSRPTFPEIVQTLDNLMAAQEEETKANPNKRQSVDQELISSIEIVRQSRPMCRRAARLRSHSADARACANPTAPCDKARCHSARRVAELASRRDPHYRPMTANPFHALGGVKKILGDLFSSCLELTSLEDVEQGPVESAARKFKPHAAQNDCIAKVLERKKPSSEPSSPTARKKWERKVRTAGLRHRAMI